MICSVCNIDKDENEFQQYWHSTQNKMRKRKQCSKCFYEKRQKNKNPDKFYSNNPNFKKCTYCETWKPLTEYYLKDGKPVLHRCKRCELDVLKQKREIEYANNGGNKKVPLRPNKYFDNYQKENTFQLMELMGYTFNQEMGVWFKPGVKELIDGKIVFPKINKYKKRGKPSKVTKTVYEQIITLHNRNWATRRISQKLFISDSTVHKYINEWKNSQI